MVDPIKNAKIVLGVTGSIANYKALDLASKLTQAEAKVDVVMTQSATHFVNPLAFMNITHRPVTTDLFDPNSPVAVNHVALAESTDLVIVAPCTANTIGKIANGIANNALDATIMATQAPLIIAPAMDANMFNSPALQENLAKLIQRKVFIAGPAKGRLASGLIGMGRLIEVNELVDSCRMTLGKHGDLEGVKLVVTAGGTVEPIDPVRSITNRSSGRMGYSLAEAARDRGAYVTLISAPSNMEQPVGIHIEHIENALEMKSAVDEACLDADAIIMAAAVADWRPKSRSFNKEKKDGKKSWSIELIQNPDIIAEVKSKDLIKIGFAAESEDLEVNAKSKIITKGLDLIVANDITSADSGFSVDTNKVTLIHADSSIEHLPLMPKYEVAHAILDRMRTGLNR